MKFELDRLSIITKVVLLLQTLLYGYFTYYYGSIYFINNDKLMEEISRTGSSASAPSFYLINTIISVIYILVTIMLFKIKDTGVYIYCSLVVLDILFLLFFSRLTLLVLSYKILVPVIVGLCIYKDREKYFI